MVNSYGSVSLIALGNGEEITGGNGEEIRGSIASYSASKHQTFRKCSFEFSSICPGESSSRREDLIHTMFRLEYDT